jgi:tRNA-splicing ligase RtcB
VLIVAQADFERAMEGIVCDTNVSVRDEAPQAYKNFNEVMKNQADLVEVVTRLKPLVNVKGF